MATDGGRKKRQGEGEIPTNEQIQMMRSICFSIAAADDEAFLDISTLRDSNDRTFSDILPLCPLTKALLDLSPMFQGNQFTTQPGDCYRSLDLYTPVNVAGYQFASVCCYGETG